MIENAEKHQADFAALTEEFNESVLNENAGFFSAISQTSDVSVRSINCSTTDVLHCAVAILHSLLENHTLTPGHRDEVTCAYNHIIGILGGQRVPSEAEVTH